MALLEIKNLHAKVDDEEGKEILKGFNLTINEGEIHAIMGPNGTGKSTLSKILAGSEEYEVTDGSVDYKGEDLLEAEAFERANEGIFLAFQYPVEIPGIATSTFLRHALNAKLRHNGKEEMDNLSFIKLLREKAKPLNISDEMLKRPVNVGFSGGEKKRMETLQMALLDPSLGVLDETDSGLDIDALRTVAEGVNYIHNDTKSFLIITHYQRLLDYIKPDFVHVMVDGKIVKTGDHTLALELEKNGYQEYLAG
ncbi:MAG: Fe-S cluster assembly ATPase SufC [Alphaproteobacteria bacterium]